MIKSIPLWINNQKLVQLSQLPLEQAKAFREFLPLGCIRKLVFQGIELHDCVAFDMYEYWFNSTQVQRSEEVAILDF